MTTAATAAVRRRVKAVPSSRSTGPALSPCATRLAQQLCIGVSRRDGQTAVVNDIRNRYRRDISGAPSVRFSGFVLTRRLSHAKTPSLSLPSRCRSGCIRSYIFRAGGEWRENGSLESPATRAWTTRAEPVHGRFRWQSTAAGHDVPDQGPSQQTAATASATTPPTPKPLRKGHGRSSGAVSRRRARGPGRHRSPDRGRAPGRQRCTLHLCNLRSPVLRHTEGKPVVTVRLIVAAAIRLTRWWTPAEVG